MKLAPQPLESIACPHCGVSFPITTALQEQLIAPLRMKLETEAVEKAAALTKREEELREKESRLAAAEETIENEVAKRVARQRASLEESLRKEARDSVAVELEDMRRQVTEQSAKITELQQTELALRERERKLEDDKKSLELEVARKVDAERQKIEAAVSARIAEEYQLREKEHVKQMQDLRDQLSEMKRKAEQGSQQMQGEVLELELEQLLKTTFPIDVVKPVPKGIPGADVLQGVMTPSGHRSGVIIWESKRTKNWSDGWVGKLKDDQRKAKADIAVLVTQALPKGVTNFGQYEGVWVSTYACALELAAALRQGLIQLMHMKIVSVSKDEKMEVVFNFLTGSEFRNRVQAIVETFIAMKTDLETEKRVWVKRWAQREKQIECIIDNTAGMYGDLQGLIGASMQSIPALEAGEEVEATYIAGGELAAPL
jgi:hypothetical protein